VCTYAPQFADANQHDAQEFLIFLLDGLHEDLNRVLQRVNVETRPEREAEVEALSTQIACEQEWSLYRMRNNSIVVDYFQGQFRNRMECMTCHKV
jgi:ubiquitin carboxyl-terminal hydrolase 8